MTPGSSFLTDQPCRTMRQAVRCATFYYDEVIGTYAIDEGVQTLLADKPEERGRIAAVIAARALRTKSPDSVWIVVDEPAEPDPEVSGWVFLSVDRLLAMFPDNVRLFEESLLNLSHAARHPGDLLVIDETTRWRIYSPTDAVAQYVLDQLTDLGYLARVSHDPQSRRQTCRIRARGWEKLIQLRESRTPLNQAFVAMWFHPETAEIFTAGIRPAVEACGLACVRIDLKEHNNKICDEIVAEIRRSRVVVADFTGNRGGVYFEAGYGQARGMPVIWTVREDHIRDLHFDTRQYNHIVYRTPSELRTRLENRIRATLE